MKNRILLITAVSISLLTSSLIGVFAADPTQPGPGKPMPACAPGQIPSQANPCAQGNAMPQMQPCAPGQTPTQAVPCEQSGSPTPSTSDASGTPTQESLSQTFSSKYATDPTQTFFDSTTSGGGLGASNKVGIFFASNVRGVVLPSIEVRKSAQNGASFNAHLCKGIDDPSCDPSQGWNGIKIVSGIGNCYQDPNSAASCVESFSLIGSDGKEYKATPEVKFPANAAQFPGSPGIYPPGQAPWLWKIDGDPSGANNEYLLAGYINSSSENKSVQGPAKLPGRGGVVDGKWLPLVQTFNFEVIPVYKESAPGIKAPLVQEVVGPGGLHRVLSAPVQGCYAADDEICLNRRPFPDGAKVKITLHLSRRVSGWLVGRLDKPEISTSHITDHVDRVNVVAGVSQDVFAGNYIPLSETVKSALSAPTACPNNNKFGAVIGGTQMQMGMDPGESCAIDFYQKVGPILGDKAYAITPSWTLTTAQKSSSTSTCITDVDGLAGVGATNASAYDPGAPTYNAAKSSLTYRVAAPSLAPDGSSIAGRYALSMLSSVFQCLYNVKTIPAQAKLAITNVNGTTVTQTVLLNQANGWVNFAANNFDFSDTSLLTITLGSQTAATPATSPSASTATTSKAATKATIKCVKGKVLKSITGSNPLCPAGYVKK